MFRFLDATPGRLTLFLCGYNKGYLCRPRAAREYLTFIRYFLLPNMTNRNCGGITICKTTEPADMNTFGSFNATTTWTICGPDWDVRNIYI